MVELAVSYIGVEREVVVRKLTGLPAKTKEKSQQRERRGPKKFGVGFLGRGKGIVDSCSLDHY
eukprot:610312-Amphidinium_carterae.1